MKVGDLIEFKSSDPVDRRCIGVILKRDTYCGRENPTPSPPEPIIEVLWNTSQVGWIAEQRVEVINET